MLLNLPLELVELVLLNLSYDDIKNIRCCNKILNQIISRETFWEKIAMRDFGVDLPSTKSLSSAEESVERNFSSKVFYREVLLKYGNLLPKVWQQVNYEYYGGLFKLLYHNHMIYLIRLDPPPYPSTHKPLQPQIICRLYVKPDSNKIVVDYLEDISFDTANDKLKEDLDNGTYSLNVKMEHANDEPKYSIILSTDALYQTIDTYRHWQLIPDNERKEEELSKRLGIPRDMAGLRFRHYMQYFLDGIQLFEPISSIGSNLSKDFPIKPGIFKATYGSHGIELIRVYYNQESNQLVGWKITGDPNVPLGETSFIAYLEKPIIHHSLDDENDDSYFANLRSSFDRSMNIENNDLLSKIENRENPSPQPFDLPRSLKLHGNLPLEDLKTYKWRFASQIQIAMAMFQEPRYVDAHIIIFSENTLAVINIDLKSLKICHRVEERLDGAVNYEEFLVSQTS